ncbi:MAG: TonB-dependent receptor [Desulfobacteraceae bacterium]|nr:MAG: TonB-dependent receptor [Desulfobacteraceae bacterium]
MLCLWAFLFLSFDSVRAAAAEEKKEEKTVLKEITVTETAYANPATPVTTRYGTQYNLVTEEQIEEQNAFDFQSTLRDVPGVLFQSKNLIGSQTSHSLYIRGRGASHPSADFAINFDGAPRFGALFGQVLGDGIAVSTIGGVEVYKSPQPAFFGSGYALVNVLPKYLKEEGQELSFDFSGGSYATFSQSLSGGIRQEAADFYASQSWVSTDGHLDHSYAQQQSYYANTGYRISSEWEIRLLANHVSSETEAPMPEIAPTPTNGVSFPGAERYDTETTFTTLTLNHQYERCSGYLKAYWDETDFDLLQELNNGSRYAGGTGGLWSRQEISLYGVRAREKLLLWPGGEILAGADLDRTELKNTQRTFSGLAVPGINGGQAARIWDFPDTTLISPYIAVSQMIGRPEGFHVSPSGGFRYFDHSEFEGKTSGQAGLVAGYRCTDLNFNYARGVNYPSPVVLMNFVLANAPVSDPDQYWEDIKPEVVDHYEVGLTHTWQEVASLGATVFYDQGKDRFQAYMFGPIPIQFNDPIGEYEIRGFELTATATPSKGFELFTGATWLDAEATGSDGIECDHLPYTPAFQLQAGFTWAFLKNFRLFMDMQHLHDLYQGTGRRSGTFNFSELTEADKLDDITLFNGRVSYRFDYGLLRLKDSELFVAVNNIFNQDYEYAKGYSMPGTTAFAGFSLKFL